MGFAEIFVATHDEALKRAAALEKGSDVSGAAVRILGISDFEVEQLGDLAGTAVHAAGADYELALVDVTSDTLLGVPEAMVRALSELLSYETEGEGSVLDDVAERWAAQEDMPFDAQQSRLYVQQLAALASDVEKAERAGLEIPPAIWHNRQVLDPRGPSLRVCILSLEPSSMARPTGAERRAQPRFRNRSDHKSGRKDSP
jgi:hypothetical protein